MLLFAETIFREPKAMHEIMRKLVNTIGSEPLRLALLSHSRDLTTDNRALISNARLEAPEPYRTIISAVSDYCDLRDEKRLS